jgi:hypothetical protein
MAAEKRPKNSRCGTNGNRGLELSVRAGSYEFDPPTQLLYLGVLTLGGGVALYVFFVLRRRWVERHYRQTARRQYPRLRELPRDCIIVPVLRRMAFST